MYLAEYSVCKRVARVHGTNSLRTTDSAALSADECFNVTFILLFNARGMMVGWIFLNKKPRVFTAMSEEIKISNDCQQLDKRKLHASAIFLHCNSN